MRGILDCSFKQVMVAVFASCTVASVVCASTVPNAVGFDPGNKINVNRVNKGNRLQMNPTVKPARSNSSETSPLPMNVPVGCEPIFSPVTDPAFARAVRQCVT